MRHLRAICTIADHGSISRAAIALKTSQPALAAQLRRIETMFGGPLFDRGSGGTHPTQLGRWVLVRSRSLLPAFDELQRDGRRYASKDTKIRMGCMSSHLALYVMKSLRELLPDAEVTMRTEEAMDILPGLLASERLELATLGDYPEHELTPPPGVVYSVIATEPIFVGLAETHPLARQREIDLSDLAGEEWSMPALVEVGHREHFWEVCATLGFAPHVTASVTLSVALDLISAARCVGMFQATSRGYPGVAIRPLKGTPLQFRHLIGWTEDGPVERHGSELVAAVRKAYWTDSANAPIYSSWLDRHGALPQPQEPHIATI